MLMQMKSTGIDNFPSFGIFTSRWYYVKKQNSQPMSFRTRVENFLLFRFPPLLAAIMEDAVLPAEHRKANRQGCQLGCRDSQPDAVDAQKLRQHQNRCHLKQQRAQKRNQSAGDAVPPVR